MRYTEALTAFRAACEHRRAARAHDLLDRLLLRFGERYARAKREVSGLDFEDLELECRELLRVETRELRERYRARFERIMVDELQDTNRVQLELIESIAREQPVHGRRRPAVDLRVPARRRRAVRAPGRAAGGRRSARRRSTPTSARGRRSWTVINGAFDARAGRTLPRAAGRACRAAPAGRRGAARRAADRRQGRGLGDCGGPRPRRGGWPRRGRWRRRVEGCHRERRRSRGTSLLLTRATTDLRVYERALEERGIPTYVIGGRGYWSHPQVIDMVGYLRGAGQPAGRGGAVHGPGLAAGRACRPTRSWSLAAAARARRTRPVVGAARARRTRSMSWAPAIADGWRRSPTGSPPSGVAGAGARRGTDRPRARAHRLRPRPCWPCPEASGGSPTCAS